MDQRTELRDFLRTRRARLTPDEVGLIDYGPRRRLPGLRREEVAQLAGISVDYYVRLEQGRSPHVSATVLDSVCRALRLTADERAYLHQLVKPQYSGKPSAVGSTAQRIRPALRTMVECLDHAPAYILGRRMDVLAMNRLATLVFPALSEPADGRINLARFVFGTPRACELFVDWQAVASSVAAYLRMDGGRHPDDPELAALVGELSIKSEDFRRAWAEHPVADRGHGLKRLRHPLVGVLTLSYETLRADDDLMVVVFHPVEAESATSLQLLANWGSTELPAPDRR